MGDYKQDIVNTRKGGLGSSDAAMVLQVANSMKINDGANQRIAVMLGIIEKPDFHRNHAMVLGDDIEMKVFDDFKDMYKNAVSNPLYKSQVMAAEYGFDVLNHIDIEVETDDELLWFEVKASKLDTADVLKTYNAQLAWHWLLLDEKATHLKKTPRLFLLHYPTTGMMTADSYDTDQLRHVEIKRETVSADISQLTVGLSIIANAIGAGFQYHQPEELEAYDLPAETQEALVALQHKIDTIKQYEAEIAEFKEGVKEQMEKHGIKSIKCEAFRITYVGESTKTSFDSAAFKRDEPELYAKYFNKVSTTKAYVQIK